MTAAPTNTPWGLPTTTETIADGITLYSTPSHGGIYLDEARNALLPEAWRAATWGKMGVRGWYEEDCDIVLVVLAFPQHFAQNRVCAARFMFKAYWVAKLPADDDLARRYVTHHRFEPIYHHPADGYSWSGTDELCETICEAKREIDAAIAVDQASDPSYYPPLDTPSLDTSFHDIEMEI